MGAARHVVEHQVESMHARERRVHVTDHEIAEIAVL
jgi:hypothetical protein